MALVPQNLLKKYTCVECNGYLKCSPIYLQPNGNNICGNCAEQYTKENQGIRNTAFEQIATIVLVLPCQYTIKGCTYKLPFNMINIHETGCLFRVYNCPVQRHQNCSWAGSISEVEQHVKEHHAESFLANPGKIVLRLDDTTEQFYLLVFVKFKFVVQIKYDSSLQKILHCVRVIGNKLLVKPFEYVIRIGTQSQNLWKKCSVESYDNQKINLEIDAEVLKNTDTNTEISEREIEVFLSLKDDKCRCCSKINLDELKLQLNGYICKDCLAFAPCLNAKSGCCHLEKKLNLTKHKKLFCKFANEPCFVDKCDYICKNDHLMQHLVKKHYIPKIQQTSKVYIYKSNTKYVESIIYQNSNFLFFINFTEENIIHIRLLTNVTRESFLQIPVVLKFINQLSGIFIEKEMILDCHAELYDFYLDFEDNGEEQFLYDLDENGVKRKHCSLNIFIRSIPNIM